MSGRCRANLLCPLVFVAFTCWASAAAGQSFVHGTPRAVIDANELRVVIGSETRVVRLLGVEAPRIKAVDQSTECFALEAARFVARFVSDSTIVLERDESVVEVEGDSLSGYVYVQPGVRDLNAELIRQGLARVARNQRFRRRAEFQRLEDQARRMGVGAWSACPELKTGEPALSGLGERKLVDDAQGIIDELARKPASSPSAAAPRTSSPSSACCVTCKKGKACGNSCISATKTCHKPPGCACNG